MTTCTSTTNCAICGTAFPSKMSKTRRGKQPQRFCGRRCSAIWRMNTPEHVAKLHTPAARAKRAASMKLRPCPCAGWNRGLKMSDAHRKNLQTAMRHHKPHVRRGNGTGMTAAETAVSRTLPNGFIHEYAISLGKRQSGYPTCYKVDFGNPKTKIAVEVDGASHNTRLGQARDRKKEAKLQELGWLVLRVKNQVALSWCTT